MEDEIFMDDSGHDNAGLILWQANRLAGEHDMRIIHP